MTEPICIGRAKHNDGILRLVHQAEAHSIDASPAARCKALAAADFGAFQDAPTEVIEAKAVEPNADMPAYCQVQGYVSPQVGFELRLPTNNWNGKFMEVAAEVSVAAWISYCSVITRCKKGYACLITDMGHKSTMLDGKWPMTIFRLRLITAFAPRTSRC